MNSHVSHHKDGGFTFIDFLIVVATVALLIGLASVWPTRRRGCHVQYHCVSNLKQVGLGLRIWSNDHQDRFPWMVSTNDGGTLEYTQANEVFRHFEIASNELGSPHILRCPQDQGRVRATWFGTSSSPPLGTVPFLHTNLSYFAGLTSDENKPDTILSGDRNISVDGIYRMGVITITQPRSIRWTQGIHGSFGNVGLADGSVNVVKNRGVCEPAKILTLPARLAIP